ncbi:MAG: alcohol dehydrogenase catalytic domain-containing protein [Asticcacaulis sp.]|nr:alcohol dehydrogenase catalytic domain-containing protein [Asticcacaulis sp.]
MRAALLTAAQADFTLADLPKPEPKAGEVRVRIKASGVNPLDTKIRAGVAAHARQPLPAVLGMDLAGVVETVGDGVTAFKPGDEVYGMATGIGGLQGSQAEYAAVDADFLALKPAALDFRQAAALPLVVITAWEGLVDHARLQPGQTVLVLGGAGGVGHVTVQIARAMGAKVFATASRKDFDYRPRSAPRRLTVICRSLTWSRNIPAAKASISSMIPSAARPSTWPSRR